MAFEGDGADKRAVPVVMPVYHDDAPIPEPIESSQAELLRRIFAILEDDNLRGSIAVRIAAIKYHWRLTGISQRVAARAAKCSAATLNRTIRDVKRFFRGRSTQK
jgi:hypothetical protein